MFYIILTHNIFSGMDKMMKTDNGIVEENGSQDPTHILKIREIEKHFHRGLLLVLVFTGLITDPLLPDSVATSPKNSIIGTNTSK